MGQVSESGGALQIECRAQTYVLSQGCPSATAPSKTVGTHVCGQFESHVTGFARSARHAAAFEASYITL
jgi:hypothetical protein